MCIIIVFTHVVNTENALKQKLHRKFFRFEVTQFYPTPSASVTVAAAATVISTRPYGHYVHSTLQCIVFSNRLALRNTTGFLRAGKNEITTK